MRGGSDLCAWLALESREFFVRKKLDARTDLQKVWSSFFKPLLNQNLAAPPFFFFWLSFYPIVLQSMWTVRWHPSSPVTSLSRCLLPHGSDPFPGDVKIDWYVYLFILPLVCVGFGPSFLVCRQHHSALSAPSIKTKQPSEHCVGPLSKASYLSVELWTISQMARHSLLVTRRTRD